MRCRVERSAPFTTSDSELAVLAGSPDDRRMTDLHDTITHHVRASSTPSDTSLDAAPDTPCVPFATTGHGRWSDIDQNGHMRTATFLNAAEDSRMQYFAAHGFTMDRFTELRLGPVIQRDELEYRAEVRLLETFTVELCMAGLADDGARFRMRNSIVRRDGRVAMTATSTGGWLDLERRRLTAPPAELVDLLRSLERTDDFVTLSSPLDRGSS